MRLILYTGSGGAGTTTLTVATAQALAAAGHRVIVGAVADATALADCLGDTAVTAADPVSEGGNRPGSQHNPAARLAAGHAGSLVLLPIALGRPAQEWGTLQQLLLTALNRAGLDRALAEEAPQLPGLDAVRAVFALLEVSRRDDADIAVVDLGPWAAAADLLSLPGRLAWLLQRLIAAPTEFGSALRPLALLTGQRAGSAAVGIARALAAADTVSHLLRSDQARLRLVLGPGPGTAPRLARQVPLFALAGARVELAVANRAGTWSGPASADLSAVLPGVPVLPTPDVLGPVEDSLLSARESATLASVTTALSSGVPELSQLDRPAVCLAPRVEPTAEGYRLAIRVPSAGEDGLRVQRREDDLLVSIDGRRHLVPLTGALRRCQVTGAAHSDGELLIGFSREASRWSNGD